MLNETFLHLPGIGPLKERRLWREGVHTWGDAGSEGRARWLSHERREVLARCAAEAEEGRWDTMAELLDPGEHWRALVRRDGDGVKPLRWLALDIETTGLRPPSNHTTVIGICGHATNFEPVALVADQRDWAEPLADYLKESDVLLSFNGRQFDVPFLLDDLGRYHFRFPPFHVDLYFALRRLDITGGLKRIQQELGYCRDDDIEDLNGYAAVILWQDHNRGRPGALETLVRYCLEDVVVLLDLAVLAYDRLAAALERPWRCPPAPPVSMEAFPYDRDVALRIGRRTRKR
ncbi:MAG: ribonuclease H-like domain-containing protein [Pseudomonadota bacterium]